MEPSRNSFWLLHEKEAINRAREKRGQGLPDNQSCNRTEGGLFGQFTSTIYNPNLTQISNVKNSHGCEVCQSTNHKTENCPKSAPNPQFSTKEFDQKLSDQKDNLHDQIKDAYPDCAICLEKLEKNKVAYPCGHILHKECYEKLKQHHGNNCPTCKKKHILGANPIYMDLDVTKLEAKITDLNKTHETQMQSMEDYFSEILEQNQCIQKEKSEQNQYLENNLLELDQKKKDEFKLYKIEINKMNNKQQTEVQNLCLEYKNQLDSQQIEHKDIVKELERKMEMQLGEFNKTCNDYKAKHQELEENNKNLEDIVKQQTQIIESKEKANTQLKSKTETFENTNNNLNDQVLDQQLKNHQINIENQSMQERVNIWNSNENIKLDELTKKLENSVSLNSQIKADVNLAKKKNLELMETNLGLENVINKKDAQIEQQIKNVRSFENSNKKHDDWVVLSPIQPSSKQESINPLQSQIINTSSINFYNPKIDIEQKFDEILSENPLTSKKLLMPFDTIFKNIKSFKNLGNSMPFVPKITLEQLKQFKENLIELSENGGSIKLLSLMGNSYSPKFFEEISPYLKKFSRIDKIILNYSFENCDKNDISKSLEILSDCLQGKQMMVVGISNLNKDFLIANQGVRYVCVDRKDAQVEKILNESNGNGAEFVNWLYFNKGMDNLYDEFYHKRVICCINHI